MRAWATPGVSSRRHTTSCTSNHFAWILRRTALPLEVQRMPAITVDDITVLPRIPAPDPVLARERAVKSVTRAPSAFEGEGFPVRRAFAGVDLRDLDPFIHLDQMGEVEYAPGEPKGTPWHPAPRLRDRDLHDRRHHGARRLERRRRQHHQRRHAVDDRRRRHPPHREAARASRRQRRPVPWLPAVGQPARAPRSGPIRATRTCAPTRSRWWPPPMAGPWCASSPARSAAIAAPAPRTRP